MSRDRGDPSRHLRLFRWREAIQKSDLKPVCRLVAYALSMHMNGDCGSCFPSQSTLARETGLSTRAVQMAIAELERRGYLRVERGGSPKGGKRAVSRYVGTLPMHVVHGSALANRVQGSGTTGAYGASQPLHDAHATGAPGAQEDVKQCVNEIDGHDLEQPQPTPTSLADALRAGLSVPQNGAKQPENDPDLARAEAVVRDVFGDVEVVESS